VNGNGWNLLKSILKYLILAAIILVVLFPIYWMVVTSFKTRLELTSSPPTLFPQIFTWENYRNAFVGREFPKYMLNSVIVVTGSTAVALVIGALAGYSLARFPMSPRFKQNISFWILSTRMIPPIVTIIPIFLIFKNLHLLNTYLGLGLVYTGFALPFAVWMMRAFIQEVPVDLEEAALVDGDTRISAFFRIVLPLAAPGLAATAVFSIIVLWNEFLFALILTTTAKTITLPVGIAGLVSQYELLWGEMGAAGTVAIIPILIFSLSVQRYLVRGLTLGAIK
jgi:multiple sugar transport system permease protein